MSDALTTQEAAALARCEEQIRGGVQSVWTALLEIRESRLYREGFDTFEDYCRERWTWTSQHANRLIAAGKVIELLEPIGFQIESERVARPLTALPPAQQIEAAKDATGAAAELGQKVTGDLMEEAAERRKRDLPVNPGALSTQYRDKRAGAKKPKAEKATAPAPTRTYESPDEMSRKVVDSTIPKKPSGAPKPPSAGGFEPEGQPDERSGEVSEEVPVVPSTRSPSAFMVRDAVRAAGVVLHDPKPEERAALTAADREWFQSVSRWAQLWAAACPARQGQAA
jgi:hypothetical protein